MTPRFTLLQQIGYAWWFCRRDLWSSATRWVSLAIVAAVTLATGTALVALALPGVSARIRLIRLAEDPWARGVWVQVRPLEPKLTDDRARALEHSTRELARDPGANVTIAGFHEIDVWMTYANANSGLRRRGRTIGPNDSVFPVLKKLLQHGDGFDAPEADGVILSPRLVTRLGGTLKDPPKTVRVEILKTNRLLEWKVVGVTRDPLPLDYDFLITEAAERQSRAQDTWDRQSAVWSGPIPTARDGPDRKWPDDWDEYPEAARKAAAGWGLEVAVEKNSEYRLALKLSTNNNSELDARWWREHMAALADTLERGGLKLPNGFTALQPDKQTAPPPPEPLGPYPRGTIYVENFQHLRPAVNAALEADLYADAAALRLVDEIEATAKRGQLLVLGVVVAFCVAQFFAMWLALYLRGRHKAAQVGMLRAMGAGQGALRTIVFAEAAILWFIGTLSGLTVAVIGGFALWRASDVTPAELAQAAEGAWVFDWALFSLGFLFLSLAGCVLGNWLATHGVRRCPPAQALGLSA